MEKVKITKDQEKRLLELKVCSNMVVFIHDNNADINYNSPFSKFSDEELALIWMGHYEVLKPVIDVIREQLRACLEQGKPNEYTDALSYCIRVLESREGK